MTSSGYKTTRTGLKLGTGFEQYEDLFININITNYYYKRNLFMILPFGSFTFVSARNMMFLTFIIARKIVVFR